MSRQEKLQKRLVSKPKDFTWAELTALMQTFSYEVKRSGGSGRKFVHPGTGATLFVHEPHPGKILKSYQVRDAVVFLTQEGHLHERNAAPQKL
jgi:hypothetical protein